MGARVGAVCWPAGSEPGGQAAARQCACLAPGRGPGQLGRAACCLGSAEGLPTRHQSLSSSLAQLARAGPLCVL